VNFREHKWTQLDADIAEFVQYGATQGLSVRKHKFKNILFASLLSTT